MIWNVRAIRIAAWRMIVVALLCAAPSSAWAAEVRFEISQREAYLGAAVELRITVENAADWTEPTMPAIDGAAVQPRPSVSRSTQVSVVNGRMTQSESALLTYRVVPSREGVVVIPPITVAADGKEFTSEPIELLVTKSETGDLLFAEILAAKDEIYVGEPVDLTLRIWIKPYTDREFSLRVQARDMWNMVDLAGSTWGDFAEALGNARDAFGAMRLDVEEVLRDDGHGGQRAYYQYDWPISYWPQQPGGLDLVAPTIIVNYPVRLGRDAGGVFRSGGLRVAEHRPVMAEATMPAVKVLTPPEQGRPESFAGAVGQFDLQVSATPTEVAVGDPITLTMTVLDRTARGARLDLLPPPPLERQANLVESFRMPSDPLAGVIDERRRSKTFTQTLRANSEQASQIPPIEFTYFDPESETYVTRSSPPIPLKVRASASLELSDVIGGGATTAMPTELTESAGGILANYSDVDKMLASQAFVPDWKTFAILTAPPMAFAAIAAARWRKLAMSRDERGVRRRRAARRAARRLNDAAQSDGRAEAQAVSSIMGEYVADRLHLPPGAMTRDDALRHLKGHGVPDALLLQVDDLLSTCDACAYGGAMPDSGSQTLSRQATRLLDELERSRWG